MTKSVTCPDELGALASQVTGDYSQLAVQGRLAAHTAEPEEVRTSSAFAIWMKEINSGGKKKEAFQAFWKLFLSNKVSAQAIMAELCVPRLSVRLLPM